MQFLSFIPRYFARRKAVPEARVRHYQPLTHEGECVLAELQGLREDARVHANEVFSRMEWFRAQMKSWDGNGLPATREEFDALCPSVEALKREEIARAGAVFHFDGKSLWPVEMAKQAAEGARAAAGLSVNTNDICTDAPVYDADHDLQIMGILGVNAKAAWVLVADLPVQLTEHGHIKSRRMRFQKIVQFDPNDQSSGSFHCYGRLPDGKESV